MIEVFGPSIKRLEFFHNFCQQVLLSFILMVFVEEGDHVEHTEEAGTAMPDLPQRHLSSVSAENDQAGLRLSV